ncbi:hypothetical protein F5890DRAFT_1593445, partial [Lentinula detonsa]
VDLLEVSPIHACRILDIPGFYAQTISRCINEEHRNKLPPVEEPLTPLASRLDFPSDHWVEPIEEDLQPLPHYPEHCVSVVIPSLPSLSPPAEGLVIGALRIPRCTSCAKRRIKCADDETSAARNAHLARGEKVGKRRGKKDEEVEEDDEEDCWMVHVPKGPRLGLRERYPRGAQSLEDHILIENRRIREQQEMTLRVMDQMEERQERIENELAKIARLLEAEENEAKEGSKGVKIVQGTLRYLLDLLMNGIGLGEAISNTLAPFSPRSA